MELNEALEKILELQEGMKQKDIEMESIKQQHTDLTDTHNKTLSDMNELKESNMRLYLKLSNDVEVKSDSQESDNFVAQDWDDFVNEM